MRRYVLTQVADCVFAVDADLVLEIVEIPWLSRWPGSPEGVLGMADYRGTPAPVVDLSKRLGGPDTRIGIHSQLIFFESFPGRAALLVESATDLVELDELAHHPLQLASHPGLLTRAGPYLRELVTIGDQVAMVLDAARLIDFRPVSRPPLASPDCAQNWPVPPTSADSLADFAPFNPEERALLRERALSLAGQLVTAASQNTLDVVVLRLGPERFALDVKAVAELIRNAPVTPVPGGPPHLLGLIYHRGGLMRLVDIRPQLGLSVPSPDLAEVIVLNGEGMLTGIGVDAIDSVVSLDPDQFQPHSSGEGSLPSLGSLSFQGNWLTLLDLTRLQVREP